MGGRGGASGLSTGNGITFDLKGKDEKFKDSVKVLKSLSKEYDTRLHEVSVGAEKAAGDVDISGYRMRLSSSAIEVAIHEFAHTLASSSADKYGLTNHAEFWKEIKKVQREYKKKVGNDTSKWISSYEHSRKGPDEFFAEAFAHAKMRSLGLPKSRMYGSDYTYSEKVLGVVDKYFKKRKKK